MNLKTLSYASQSESLHSAAVNFLYSHSQVLLRDILSAICSEQVSQQQEKMFSEIRGALPKRLASVGIIQPQTEYIYFQYLRNSQHHFALQMESVRGFSRKGRPPFILREKSVKCWICGVFQ